MRNGRLKLGYHVQAAVNSEFITGIDVFSNRTDFGTLIPLLRTMQKRHGTKYEEVTADAGYESLDDYLYLERNGRTSFIKPANYEQKKSQKFKQQIGRVENTEYDAEEDRLRSFGAPSETMSASRGNGDSDSLNSPRRALVCADLT